MYLHIKNQTYLGDHIFAYRLNEGFEMILFYSHTFYYKFLYFVPNRKASLESIYKYYTFIYIMYS